MFLHGFSFSNYFGLTPGKKEKVSIADFGKGLAQVVVAWSNASDTEVFFKELKVVFDSNFKRIFSEELFFLNGWLMEFCIQASFCKKPKIRDRLIAIYSWALNAEQKRMEESAPYSPSEITELWLIRRRIYNENVQFGLDKVPIWLWDYVRDRLGVPPDKGIDWMTNHIKAYDVLKLQFLLLVKTTIAFFNSIRDKSEFF